MKVVTQSIKSWLTVKARLQPFTVLFFSAWSLFVLLHSNPLQFMKKWVDLSVNKTNKDRAEKKSTVNGCKRVFTMRLRRNASVRPISLVRIDRNLKSWK